MVTPLLGLSGMSITLFRPNPKGSAASFETSFFARGQPHNYNVTWCSGAQKDFSPHALWDGNVEDMQKSLDWRLSDLGFMH